MREISDRCDGVGADSFPSKEVREYLDMQRPYRVEVARKMMKQYRDAQRLMRYSSLRF